MAKATKKVPQKKTFGGKPHHKATAVSPSKAGMKGQAKVLRTKSGRRARVVRVPGGYAVFVETKK